MHLHSIGPLTVLMVPTDYGSVEEVCLPQRFFLFNSQSKHVKENYLGVLAVILITPNAFSAVTSSCAVGVKS